MLPQGYVSRWVVTDARKAIEAGVTELGFEILIESDTLAGVLNACRSNPWEVDADAWARCSMYYFMQANGWEYVYYQNEDESIPPELWVGGDGYFSNQASTEPGWVRFWGETAIAFGEPFRSYIDERVVKNPAYSSTKND
ncbi:MAG: hypothetical protein O3A63_14970 [Proteobacteria bacterium]|nr:hypothetical protein [Pseudomonadota bacterium]